MKKIYIVSHQNFDKIMQEHKISDSNVEHFNQIYCISIIDSESSKHYFKQDHKNVINLEFDDIERPMRLKNNCDSIFFTEEMGDKIISFLNTLINKEDYTLIIHCEAGISRSGAVGTFAREYLQLDKDEFKEDNRQILPNAHVLRTLNNAIWKDTLK